MPTLSQLKKKTTKLGYITEIEKLGFTLGSKDFWFYRRRGDVLDIIDVTISSSGNWAEVAISPYIDELIKHCDMDKFPDGFIENLSNPFEMFITEEGIEHPWHKWRVEEDSDIEESFAFITKILVEEGDKWLQSIDSKEKVYKVIEGE